MILRTSLVVFSHVFLSNKEFGVLQAKKNSESVAQRKKFENHCSNHYITLALLLFIKIAELERLL